MLVIVDSRSYSRYLKYPRVPSTSYCKFDSDLVFVQSLFTVFLLVRHGASELFWRFFSDLEFGFQIQGNPAGGEGIALSLCCGLGTRPGRGGHSSREGRNVKSKRRRIEGVKGVEIPRSARMS